VFPYSLGVLTIIQGMYSLLWVVIMMDILSPTLDLRDLGRWSSAQELLAACALTAIVFALGIVMHTISRNLFRHMKDLWCVNVLLSRAVTLRIDDLGSRGPVGGPSIQEIRDTEGMDQLRKVGEFMHAIDYTLMSHAPHVHEAIGVYRDQYRLAREFILPSIILALVVPFWEPIPMGHIATFPLVSLQIFFLFVLFAGVSMYAFRERSYRYAAARVRSYLALEAEQRATQAEHGHLAAVS
jgi:hypothetical protein